MSIKSSVRSKHVDMAFLYACEFGGDIACIQQLLEDETEPSKDLFVYMLRFAVETNLVPLLDVLLKNAPTECIDKLFVEKVSEGISPSIIHLLQDHASSTQVMYRQQYHKQLQKNDLVCRSGHYIVDVSEVVRIREIKSKLHAYGQQVFRNKTTKFQCFLKHKQWINETFLDGTHFNSKLTVSYLLSLFDERAVIRPSEQSIQEGFIHAITKRFNISLGVILGPYVLIETYNKTFDILLRSVVESYQSISENGNLITEVMGRLGRRQLGSITQNQNLNFERHDLFLKDVLDVLTWLLNGQLGFYPDQRLIDENYIRLTRFTRLGSRDTKIYELIEVRGSVAAQRDVRRETAMRVNNWMTRGVHEQADIHLYADSRVIVTPAIDSEVIEEDEEDMNETEEEEIPPQARNPVTAITMATTSSRGQTLLTLVTNCLEQRTSGILELSNEEVTDIICELIVTYLPNNFHNRAIDYVGEMLTSESARLLGLTLRFLSMLSSAASAIWIQGFLGEATAENSCQAGAQQRAITGLRGLGDEELNTIFRRAEGPHLARIF